MNEKKGLPGSSAQTRQRSGAPIRLLAACAAAVVVVPLAGPLSAQQGGASNAVFTPLVTIKELMEQTITPATNALWNAYDPPTDEEQWVALEEAAVTLLVASNVNALGGTGPMDNEWVQEPSWGAFNQVMINAGRDALAAIRARDHEALLEAGDVLYPPCEGCHQLFNPGVVSAQ
jgi:hypothetical protein